MRSLAWEPLYAASEVAGHSGERQMFFVPLPGRDMAATLLVMRILGENADYFMVDWQVNIFVLALQSKRVRAAVVGCWKYCL
jgi:hypothetical protein